MRFRTFFLLVLLAPAVSYAGIYYESKHMSDGGPQGVHEFRVRGWVDADSAKIEFLNPAANGMMCSGCYLVTQDAGHTLVFVDPEKETFSAWDIDSMLGALGSVMESGLINVEFSAPVSEKLEESAGEPILGRSTKHTRWRNQYDMKLKVMGFKQQNSIEVIQDFWSTDELTDAGLGVWLRSGPPKTGNSSFDAIMESEMEKISGFPLRSKTVTTTINKKGKSTVTSDSMEVIEISTQEIDETIFQIPPSYTAVPLMPEMSGSDSSEMSPMEGLRGLLGRKKGKGNN